MSTYLSVEARHPAAKFSCIKHCGSRDITFLICGMVLKRPRDERVM